MRIPDLADDDWTAAYTDGLIVRACRAAGFEPQPRLDHARPARDPRADHARPGGHARAAAAGRGVRGHSRCGRSRATGPERDVYALLPPGGRHPLAQPMLAALAHTVEELKDELHP